MAAPEPAPLNYALRLLARKAYSEKALQGKLSSRFPDPAAVHKTMDKLRSMNYLNDPRLAAELARSRILDHRWGPRRVKQGLVFRHLLPAGIVAEAIQAALAEQGEAETLNQAVNKWVRSHGEIMDIRDLLRLNNFLLRQGFNPDQIRHRLAEFRLRNEDTLT